MKPLFGIDVTEDMENEVVNGTELITRTLPKKLQQELDASTNAVEQALEAGRMPRWFRFVRNLCGYFGLIVFVAVISNLGGLGMAKMMKSSPLLIIGGGLALVAWAVMVYHSRKRSVQADAQSREAGLTDALDRSMAQAYGTLGVPKNAPNVDVLSFSYRVKEGEIKPFSIMMNTTPYCNLDLRVYVQDGMLCLADLECVHTIALSSLVAIHTVQKSISIPIWSKEIGPKEGIYKPYQLKVNGVGSVSFKPYHILEFTYEGESWGIYFPCYELPTFEELTGLSAKKEVE